MTDTELAGRPDDIRAAAAFLRDALAAGTSAVADEAVDHRRRLQDAWRGESGAAFQDGASTLASAADGVTAATREIARRLTDLADALEEAQRELAEVRAHAREVGLQVRGFEIVWPPLALTPDKPCERFGRSAFIPDPDYEGCDLWVRRIKQRWAARLTSFAAAAEQSGVSLDLGTAGLIVSGYSGQLRDRVTRIMLAEAAHLLQHAETLTARADELAEQLRRGLVRPGPDFYETVDDWKKRANRADLRGAELEKNPLTPGAKVGFGAINTLATGLGVVQDLRDGESWQQAVASQGLSGIAAGKAGGIAATAAAPGGPVAAAVAFVAVGTFVAVLGDKGIDRVWEHRQREKEEVARRRRDEERRVQQILERA